MISRRKTRQIRVGTATVGGAAPIAVQSMTNTPTENLAATLAQVQALARAGCEIVRVSFPSAAAVKTLPELKKAMAVPLVADIHFQSELAVAALEAGADAVRVNPGNIGGLDKFARVVDAAKGCGAALRIGVNAGSLPSPIAERYGGASAQALLESARQYVEFCQSRHFDNFKLSLKSSEVGTAVEAYRLAAAAFDCPLHLGITEAGTLLTGTVKSSIGLGLLLAEGIGDTLRVSLSADPLEEVRVGWEILKALGIRQRGLSVIACPTCSRTGIDVCGIAERVERLFAAETRPLRVAVMGCPVNGPGEAKEADIGLAGSPAGGMIFCRGRVIERVEAAAAEAALVSHIRKMLKADV